jgi:hypothetical protein
MRPTNAMLEPGTKIGDAAKSVDVEDEAMYLLIV